MVDADEIYQDVTEQADIEPKQARIRTELNDEERKERAEKILEIAKNWKPSEKTDDVRAGHASVYGGFELYDDEQLSNIRSVFGIIIGKVGEKILNGDFNLTKISFPIQCMSHKSALESIIQFQSTMSVYFNYAASISDPLERFKIVVAQTFSYAMYEKFFDKPLNPILGETIQLEGQDGSKIFME